MISPGGAGSSPMINSAYAAIIKEFAGLLDIDENDLMDALQHCYDLKESRKLEQITIDVMARSGVYVNHLRRHNQ